MKLEKIKDNRYVFTWDDDWGNMVFKFKPDLDDIQENAIEQINRFDKSLNVNCFILNNKKVWIPLSLRMSISRNIEILKLKEIDFWYDEEHYIIESSIAAALLSQLEVYAIECFNVTQKHLKAINNLSSIEDVLNYDYTTGYPEKLTFTI